MKRVIAWILAGILLVPVSLFVLGCSAWAHLREPVGRLAFEQGVSTFVSSMLPGELAIEGVREVALPRVRAARLRVTAPNGPDVLVLRDVDLDLDVPASVWHGGPIIRRARVDGGGLVLLSKAPNGKTWIELAFDDQEDETPAARAEAARGQSGVGSWLQPPGDETLRIEDISFRRLRVRVDLGGPRADLRHARGRARMWLRDGSKVQMRYWSIRGDLRTEDVPDARIWGLAITVDPTARRQVRFVSQLDALDAHMALAGHAPGPDDAGVRLCLYTGGFSLTTLVGLGAEMLAPALTSSVSLDVRPSDPPRRPRCQDTEQEEEREREEEES